MSFQNPDDNNSQKIANLWGSSWQRLTPKQKQIVSETLNSLKLTGISEQLEDQVYKMPFPDFVEVAESNKNFLVNELKSQSLTLNWQFVLAKLSQALTSRNHNLIDILLVQDYLQLNRNAISDTCHIINQPCNVTIFRQIEAETYLIKKHINESRNSNLQIDYLIKKNGNLIGKLKSLDVVGISSFMLVASMQLLLLQEKAKSDNTEWINLKNQALEYINYAKSVNPKLYRLSVGQIDKTCKCIQYKSNNDEKIIKYECRYFDGRNIHVFRELSNKVGYECNKHRLQMFQTVVERVNLTVVEPLRSTIKKWQELVVQIDL